MGHVTGQKKRKNTGFLRFRLPVLLQQNLRCKVWDDTAKIRYIALFAIREQCSQIVLTFKIDSLSQQCSFRKYNTGLVRSTSTTIIPHAHIGHWRNQQKPKHATLELCKFSKQHVAINGTLHVGFLKRTKKKNKETTWTSLNQFLPAV